MSYFRPNIDAMAGYTPGEQPQTGEVVKLNTNENPYPPSPHVLEAVRRAATDRLRRYPDPLATLFRRTAGKVLNVDPEMIVACNGSDDALTILARACAGSDDLLVSPTPSYPLYRTLAQIQGCRYEERPFLSGGRLPTNLCDGAKLVLVPNPNSPTGTCVPAREMASAAENASCLVVADEAYGDFAEENCVSLVGSCERLVVTRSLSKSYSLAGVRFGFIVAQPSIARTLIKVKDSYNVDAVSIAAAAAALADQDYFRENVRKILATRGRMEKTLAAMGFSVTPSQANFVWIQRPEPVEPIYRGLKDRNILIRWLKYPGYGEGLRISVGTDEEIDRVFEVMRSLL